MSNNHMGEGHRPDVFGSSPDTGIRGVAVGIVTDNEDPKGIGRVKLKYPWRDADDESYWARMAVEMAAKKYGHWFLPEVGDEVLVAFENGNIHHPYVLGSLWSGKDKPQYDNSNGKNNHREIKSRKGHRLHFNDSKSEARFEIETKKGHHVLLEDKNGSEKIKIKDKSGKNVITMDSVKGEISIEAGKKISMKAPTIQAKAKTKVDISSKGKAKFSSKAPMKISSKSKLDVKSSGIMNIKASGPLMVKGAIIKLN